MGPDWVGAWTLTAFDIIKTATQPTWRSRSDLRPSGNRLQQQAYEWYDDDLNDKAVTSPRVMQGTLN